MLTEEIISERQDQNSRGLYGTRQAMFFGAALTLALTTPSGLLSGSEFEVLTSPPNQSSEWNRPANSPANEKGSVSAARPMLAEIIETLSLTTTQAAKAVHVSRQRIYDYRNGQEAGPETIARLQVLSRIAQHWQSLDGGSLSGKMALPFADGTSLLDLLSASEINEEEVRERLAQVASFQRGQGASPFAPRPTIMDQMRALGVSEPTEEDRFRRREDERIRLWLAKDENKG